MFGVSAFWTDEKVARMRELAAQRISASQIALAIGARTKNMVAGKCRRVGIQLCGDSPRQPLKPGSRKHRKASNLAVSIANRWRAAAKIKRREPTPLPPEPVGFGVTFADLNHGMCKWPSGDFFCGEPMVDLRYCAFHAFKSRPAAA